MLEKFAFGPRNKPHASSPTALAHDAQPRQAGGMKHVMKEMQLAIEQLAAARARGKAIKI